MGPFVLAWLVGEGIITWRSIEQQGMPPSPRQMIVASGLFALLALLAEYQPAKFVATALAWGVDIAAFLQVLPGQPAAITATGAHGWSSIPHAGNTVLIPDGTPASEVNSDGSVNQGATETTGTPGTAPTSGNAAVNQQIAQNVIAGNPAYHGWGQGSQWQCLQQLWQRESGWSTSATNPTSGAYGIAQSLHGSRGGQGGDEYNASDPQGLTQSELAAANAGDAAAQILWGLAYIASTYGNPCSAWAHEQSAGWY